MFWLNLDAWAVLIAIVIMLIIGMYMYYILD